MPLSISEGDAPHVDFSSPREFRELLEAYVRDNWTGQGKAGRGAIAAAVFGVGLVASALGAFVVLVPVTYQLGGLALHSSHGWQAWQPGVGGKRFVALNAVGWALYAASLLLSGINVLVGDIILAMTAFALGMISYASVVSSLLVYQNAAKGEAIKPKPQVAIPDDAVLKADDRTFTEDFELSALMHNGEGPSDLWWLFIGMNTVICAVGSWVGVAGDFHAKKEILKIAATVTTLWTAAAATAITHAIGGQWRHVNTGYLSFQPGKGGPKFVALQAVGWTCFSVGELLGLVAVAGQVQRLVGRQSLVPASVPLTTLAALLNITAQILVATSLFFYVATPAEIAAVASQTTTESTSAVMSFLRKTHFMGLNLVLNGGTTYESARDPQITTTDAWLDAERKFQELCDRAGVQCTGNQYLIIGCGFVGRHLVRRLLDRGETKIRIFDIMPRNPFDGDERIEYVRGDVTKYDQIAKACEGVHTVYATFAIIRFMDRLEHQAALSYRINVGGTENVLKACREHNVEYLIVTSSSHATTDEHSQPRFNRTEASPYVTRETSHNHYGWTKAASDALVLAANGAPRADGQPLRTAIIRPCSGVFGGDDGISFERACTMRMFPGLGAKSHMDWIAVWNVVLGHLLLEAAMLHGGSKFGKEPFGEAFNVSNNEGMKNEDFWWSAVKINRNLCDPAKRKTTLDFVYIPEAPLWVIAYVSELNQKIFKGKVSLGRDLDQLTPGMLATAVMEYTYNSDKAKEYLGYEPAYTVDQAIQRSFYDYWERNFPSGDKKNA